MASRATLHGRSQAILGDRTSHGGAIISGSPTNRWHGIPIARKGDMTFCPRCSPHLFEIAEGLETCTDSSNRLPKATEGHKTTCGAVLIATSNSPEMLHVISLRMVEAGHDDRYVLRNVDGTALPFVHYAFEVDGFPVEFGTTDAHGLTHLHLTGEEAREISIYIAG